MAGVKLNDKINYLPHAHTLTHTHIGGLETSIDFIKRVSACGRACALMTLFSQLLSLQDVVLTPNPRLLSQPQDADARSLIWCITMARCLCVWQMGSRLRPDFDLRHIKLHLERHISLYSFFLHLKLIFMPVAWSPVWPTVQLWQHWETRRRQLPVCGIRTLYCPQRNICCTYNICAWGYSHTAQVKKIGICIS